MNKNYIEGRYDRESWHHTAKPIGSVVEVNAAVVQGSNAFLPGEIPRRKCHGKSAEVVVAENKPGTVRGPRKHETGKLESVKGRTDEEFSTAWRTLTPIKPVGQEVSESRHDGKHGEFWGEVAWAQPKSPLPGRRTLQP
jgi:hypothetical protein